MNDRGSEYRLVVEGPALVDRGERALFEIGGRDRASWLHNLTTNQVKTLGVGEGNYAFVLNAQGRILFDLNLFVRAESIWIDLDRPFVETAQKHFSKYTITENVTLIDRTDEFSRLGLIGRRSGELLTSLGVGNAAAMASLAQASFSWRNAQIGLIRHDFCGPMGFELFVPVTAIGDFRTALSQGELGQPVARASPDVVETMRIEAGIPWLGREITEEYLPAETRQLERAVSYQKGCYLGQEVVERMRSRNVVARQLVGLRLSGEAAFSAGAPIKTAAGEAMGHLTSVGCSPSLGATIALGYVRTACASPGTTLYLLSDDRPCEAVVTKLPFVSFQH